MITGVNSDVEYRGMDFHVQTEDSGQARPHVFSHLYLGGCVLATEKTDYGDDLEREDLDERVRAIVERQHREMLEALAAGHFDDKIDARLGGAPTDRDSVSPPSDARETPALLGVLDSELQPLDEMILEHLEGGGRHRGVVPASAKARAQG